MAAEDLACSGYLDDGCILGGGAIAPVDGGAVRVHRAGIGEVQHQGEGASFLRVLVGLGGDDGGGVGDDRIEAVLDGGAAAIGEGQCHGVGAVVRVGVGVGEAASSGAGKARNSMDLTLS
jgi:hypothetical protein